jgi:hypothetical protein
MNRDEEFIGTPDKWPMWPILPVKRYVQGVQVLRVILDSVPALRYTVVEANLGMLPNLREELERLPHHVYSSAAEIVNDGWLVD